MSASRALVSIARKYKTRVHNVYIQYNIQYAECLLCLASFILGKFFYWYAEALDSESGVLANAEYCYAECSGDKTGTICTGYTEIGLKLSEF
jgi:hypothetical protein